MATAYPPRFREIIPLVLELETEFNRDGSVRVERDPNDPGGTTKFGIDQRSHPRVNVAALTKLEATEIYFAEWTKWPCDEISQPFGELVFDVRVNGGQPVEWLQQALNECSSAGLKVDGWAGLKTFSAAHSAAGDKATAAAVVKRSCQLRTARYRALAKQKRFAKYRKGWLSRNAQLQSWALAHIPALA